MPCYQTLKRISELFFNEINRLSNKYKYNPTWISGELNLPYINQEAKSVIGSQYPNVLNELFYETLGLCNLDQSVNFPIRKNHTHDLLITNKPSFVGKCLEIFRDHDSEILAGVACQPKYSRAPRHKSFMWKEGDFELLKSDLKKVISMFSTTNSIETPIDNLWRKFSKHIIDI